MEQELFQKILKDRKGSPRDLLRIYDTLEPVDLAFMQGRWKGYELETGHFMDGLLELTGWYGKIFENADFVHPLLFYTANKKKLYAVNPLLIPLQVKFPKVKALGVLMGLLRPILQTKKARARMRMIAYRGKVTGTMVYDHKAIMDHFAKIDENTMLGIMDLKGETRPYFFVLERDETPYQIRLKL